ncbi:MAG: hypothetical protein WCC69_00075 [Pirellulales bacterium]
MTPDTQAWLHSLREFAATHRERKPLVVVTGDSPLQHAERAILATDLTHRLATLGDLLAARASTAWPDGLVADPDPAIVITTSPIGIDVVAELLGSPAHGLRPLASSVVAVTEVEYRLWCIRQPDDASRLHVNLWSWVKTSVPQQRWPEFARYPLGPGETYWLHRTGVSGAGAADARHCHLWKWNGRHAALLKAFIRELSVTHLDAARDGDTGGSGGRD